MPKPYRIPKRLASRPLFHDLPIPFITKLNADGTPHFSQNEPDRILEVIRGQLCGMCGQPIGKRVSFIGSPEELAARLFIEPHQHPPCARYTSTACPYLRNPDYLVKHRPHVGVLNRPRDQLKTQPRPEFVAIYTTEEFEVVIAPSRVPLFKVGKPLNIQKV